mgnify:FL=1
MQNNSYDSSYDLSRSEYSLSIDNAVTKDGKLRVKDDSMINK